jgi:Cellulose binding domain
VGESPASNQATATTAAPSVSCHVNYTVTTQWNVGFGTAITIQNTGNTPINGWNLTWTWANQQRITQAWNSDYTQSGTNAKLTNASWNPAIAAGATISGIGFNASYTGTNTAPTAFYLNGTLCR